jgi:hypothetical protein
MDTLSLPADRFIEGDLPLYAGITLVTAERHVDALLAPDTSFAFARRAAVVPLTIDEFARAALDYPVVFFGPARRAFAVMGLTADCNLFVSDEGTFRAGAYIPAYLRRHPFVLVRDAPQDTWVLGIDEASDRLVADAPGARSLFEDGAPAPALREAVAFCEAYENAQQRTDRLVHLLDDLDLFEPREAHHRPPGEEQADPVLLLDYVAVSPQRLAALDEASIAQLRALDGLGPCYAHLFSAANWERLAILASTGDG